MDNFLSKDGSDAHFHDLVDRLDLEDKSTDTFLDMFPLGGSSDMTIPIPAEAIPLTEKAKLISKIMASRDVAFNTGRAIEQHTTHAGPKPMAPWATKFPNWAIQTLPGWSNWKAEDKEAKIQAMVNDYDAGVKDLELMMMKGMMLVLTETVTRANTNIEEHVQSAPADKKAEL